MAAGCMKKIDSVALEKFGADAYLFLKLRKWDIYFIYKQAMHLIQKIFSCNNYRLIISQNLRAILPDLSNFMRSVARLGHSVFPVE